MHQIAGASFEIMQPSLDAGRDITDRAFMLTEAWAFCKDVRASPFFVPDGLPLRVIP